MSRSPEDQHKEIKRLLEHGQKVNARDAQNRTPLHDLLKCMKEGLQERTLHLFLSYGADVDAIDNDNKSILKVALMNPRVPLSSIKMLLEYGANANECVEFLNKEMPVAQLLLQYILIKRMAKAELEPNLIDFNNYSSLLNLKFCMHLSHYHELVACKEVCMKELDAMRKERIGKNYTLFSYVNERCSTAKVNEDDLKTSITREVLSKFNQYPYCKDLIIASLKKRCILSQLRNETIYTWQLTSDCSSEEKKVHLNSDTIAALATYLSKTDMINLILAYRCGSEVSMGSTKRVNC